MKKDHEHKKKQTVPVEHPASEESSKGSGSLEEGHIQCSSGDRKETQDTGSAASDQSCETEPSAAGEARSEEEVSDRLERIQREKQELHDQYLRLLADFDNYKKRTTREKGDLIQFANESLLREILPVVDNIERLRSYSEPKGNWEAFKKGADLIAQEVQKIFTKYDVRPIEAIGKPFDPTCHEAIQKVEHHDVPPNTVVSEYQKGYTFRGKLLRPSVVSVSAPSSTEDANRELTWSIGDHKGGGDDGEEPIVN